VGAPRAEDDDDGRGGGAEGAKGEDRNTEERLGGGGGALAGAVTGELERRVVELGTGGGRPGTGASDSFALLAAAVARRLTKLFADCTCCRFSDTVRGIEGTEPVGRLGPVVDVPEGDDGGGGARPRGRGTGGLPAMVVGRFGISIGLVRGRRGILAADTVEVGRSAISS
jgi:hypothetical protein